MQKNNIPIELLRICKKCRKKYIYKENKMSIYDHENYCTKNCFINDKKTIKICKNCDKEFESENAKNEYCSENCRKDFARKKRGITIINKGSKNRNITELSNGEKELQMLITSIFYDQDILIGKFYYWLRYNSSLQLDIYLPNINLAFEYDGEQHYKYMSYFHKNKQDFLEQQDRDRFKDRRCEEEGITLIRYRDKTEYITIFSLINKLRECGRSDLLHSKYFDGININNPTPII
ncbi:MAG: hypothetical protein A2086_14180 [Spirochaetes bacterium GWD1_27_9]|nr:MAG: hypothetical protein A2Y34_05485 [Spirochaetes bacterium GWC1_27_15]OHD35458.1 MAG: hypothetical protein A2086_14180 [Spirochaetes bacterium GWD1_27_9]